MEELPKKLPREVRKYPDVSLDHPWEDSIDFEMARAFYEDIQNILAQLNMSLLEKNRKILEIGSGNAVFLDYLKELRINVVGVDARPRSKQKYKKSSQVASRIEQLPFKDEQFNIVLSLGHVFDESVYDQDQNRMIQEVFRVLKHHGVCIIFGFRKKIKFQPINELSLLSRFSNERLAVYRKD